MEKQYKIVIDTKGADKGPKMMIKGAMMGITATTKLIRENENTSCSEEALALARRTIGYEEESIERLKEFL